MNLSACATSGLLINNSDGIPAGINGGSFFASGGSQNIKAPTSTDPNTLYLIDVNFQSGIFTVTKL